MERQNPVQWVRDKLGLEFPLHQQEVLLSDAPRLLVCDRKMAGKTTLLAALATYSMFCRPGSLVLYVHPGAGSAGYILDMVRRIMRGALPYPYVRDHYSRRLLLDNGSALYSLDCHEIRKAHGLRADLLLIDDAEAMHDYHLTLLLSLRPRRIVAASAPNPCRPSSPFKSWCLARGTDWHLPYYPYFLCPVHTADTPCACVLMQQYEADKGVNL